MQASRLAERCPTPLQADTYRRRLRNASTNCRMSYAAFFFVEGISTLAVPVHNFERVANNTESNQLLERRKLAELLGD